MLCPAQFLGKPPHHDHVVDRLSRTRVAKQSCAFTSEIPYRSARLETRLVRRLPCRASTSPSPLLAISRRDTAKSRAGNEAFPSSPRIRYPGRTPRNPHHIPPRSAPCAHRIPQASPALRPSTALFPPA